jgi:hypothetical protein
VAVSTPGTGRWPARAAFLAAAIFIAASGAINITYGFNKGSDLAGSLTWAAVAGAVATVFALSWAATIRAIEAKRWGAAIVCVLALLLSGAYSISAALGSASGGRTNAAAMESATTGARERAQVAYDAAQAEFAKLQPSRPLAEIQGVYDATRPRRRIIVVNGKRETEYYRPAEIEAELGRAKRRVELEAKIAEKAAELAKAEPAKVANSDAKALARYLKALGLDIGADRLNDLLVLLAVAMVECGGGLALAVGMALSTPSARPTEARTDRASADSGQEERPPAATLDSPSGQSEHFARTPRTVRSSASVRARTVCSLPEQPSDVVQWLEHQGGRAETSMRRLASALGRSPSGVHTELCRLVASGVLTMASGPRGTALALRPN